VCYHGNIIVITLSAIDANGSVAAPCNRARDEFCWLIPFIITIIIFFDLLLLLLFVVVVVVLLLLL